MPRQGADGRTIAIGPFFLFQAFLKKGQDSRLFRPQLREEVHELLADALAQGVNECAIQISVEDRRMDVALATNRLGVAEPLGYGFDRLDTIFLRLSLRIKLLKLFQASMALQP